jgi:hypothetical protein
MDDQWRLPPCIHVSSFLKMILKNREVIFCFTLADGKETKDF